MKALRLNALTRSGVRRDQAPFLPRSRDGLLQAAAFVLLAGTWLSLLGPVSPMLVILGLATLVALAPKAALTGLLRCWPIVLVGVLAFGSGFWSTAPGVSFRYGAQLAVTLAAAVVLASTLTPGHMLRAFFLSSVAVLCLCLASGEQGPSASGPVLIGILGSKNEMGVLCQIVISSGLCLAFSRGEKPALRLIAPLAAGVAAVVLLSSFATGAVLSTILFAVLCITFVIGSRLQPAAKLMLVGGLAAFAVPLWLIRGDLQGYWEYFVVDVLGKDMGLTGRDYLWAHADRMIEDRPLIGHGYRSTWLGDGPDTIGLLRWAGQSSGAGFHFHDTYREWSVDVGLLGATLVVFCLGFGLVRLVLRALAPGILAPGLFFAATAVIYMVRAKFEVVTGPFSASTVLLASTAALGYLYMRPRTDPLETRMTRAGPPVRAEAFAARPVRPAAG